VVTVRVWIVRVLDVRTDPLSTVGGANDVTVAVNVTAWPNTDGFTLDTTAVFDGALLTVWISAADVLARKLASPG